MTPGLISSLWLLLVSSFATAQTTPNVPAGPLTAEAIMARVAANQDRTEAERSHFVYVQHAKVQSRRGSNVMCEEITDMRVTPSPHGQSRHLLALSGHVQGQGKVVHYNSFPKSWAKASSDDGLDDDDVHMSEGDHETVLDADAGGAPVTVNDTDIDLVESMRRNFTRDNKNKDGINAGLFPLTSEEQKDMLFELKGREAKNGRDTYHIVFRPKNKSDYGWKGHAWIDASDFEPVVIQTALSRSLPLGVRALLGTNVPGLGFTVIYAPQETGVWFPASFGTEFKIKVLFFFSRQIVVAVENRSFERTHVSSTIHAATADTAGPEDSSAPQP